MMSHLHVNGSRSWMIQSKKTGKMPKRTSIVVPVTSTPPSLERNPQVLLTYLVPIEAQRFVTTLTTY